MAKIRPTQTPIEAFLAPLAAICLTSKDIEGQVLWHRDGQWSDGTGELLEAEEIAFYAEGLLIEGFSMQWDALRSISDDTELIRMLFWQGDFPTAPLLPTGWQVQRTERFTAQ